MNKLDKFIVSVLRISILLTVVFSVLLGLYAGKDQLTELIWCEAYLFCQIIILFICISYMRKGKNIPLHERIDVLGLIICTVPSSMLIACLVGFILSWSITNIEAVTILLLFIFTVAWFSYKIQKTKGKNEERELLLKTAQNMAMFITLVSIAQTDMPSYILKVLFVVMGFTYTIFSALIQDQIHAFGVD